MEIYEVEMELCGIPWYLIAEVDICGYSPSEGKTWDHPGCDEEFEVAIEDDIYLCSESFDSDDYSSRKEYKLDYRKLRSANADRVFNLLYDYVIDRRN